MPKKPRARQFSRQSCGQDLHFGSSDRGRRLGGTVMAAGLLDAYLERANTAARLAQIGSRAMSGDATA
jgi:hypothetical protein